MLLDFEPPVTRIDAPRIATVLVSHQHPSPSDGIFALPLYTIALQQTQRHSLSIGRYCFPSRRDDFRDIGRLVVLPASVPLEIRSSGGLTEAVSCVFEREVFEEYARDADLYDRDIPATCLDLRHKGIAEILARLGRELRSPGLASKALVESMGTAIVIEFIRHLDEQPKCGAHYRGGLSRRQFRTITEFIEAPENCPSLSDLSELTGLSVRHLTRAFKQTTGNTLYSYIEQIRFEKAQSFLADTDVLVKTIAHRLGFSCSGAFCTAFRRFAGETPQAYRRRMGGSLASEDFDPLN